MNTEKVEREISSVISGWRELSSLKLNENEREYSKKFQHL